ATIDSVGRFTRKWRLAELGFFVTSPLHAKFVQQVRRQRRSELDVHRIDVDEVVAEVVARAGVGGLRLHARRLFPAQAVVADGQRVLVVDVPVYLRQEQFLVAGALQWTGQALEETESVFNLPIAQTHSDLRPATRQ